MQRLASHACYLVCLCLGAIGYAPLATFAYQVETSQETTDESEQPPAGLLQYVAPKTFEMVIGLELTSGNGTMASTMATTVFPTPWPEQDVEIVEANIPATFNSDFRELPGGNKQLLLFARTFPAHATMAATVKVRITKRHTVGPDETDTLTVPRRLDRDIKQYLGDSPYINSTSGEIRKIVREIDAADHPSDWQRIEAYYDWVRENIKYVNGELKTVQEALRDRSGDCEEMTSTFIALCRASKVPARCVWIPNHCYPEFYMEDGEGNGYWIPCQVAGTRNFGSMPEYLPILQKGDRFQVPEKKERQRYLADFLSAKHINGTDDPKVVFIRQLLGDAADLKTPDLAGQAQEESAAPQ